LPLVLGPVHRWRDAVGARRICTPILHARESRATFAGFIGGRVVSDLQSLHGMTSRERGGTLAVASR
jgi:hypothetical protein